MLTSALEAKNRLTEQVRKSGVRAAVGITKVQASDGYALKVSVVEATEVARSKLPTFFDGFSVVLEETGSVATQSVPTKRSHRSVL